MSDKAWKASERRFAEDSGGRRRPVTGLDRGDGDVEHSLFEFQVKVRAKLPDWLFAWLAGIVRTASRRGKVGVLLLNRPRSPRRNALVVVRWSDWCDLVGRPGEATDETEDIPDKN